MRKERTRRDWWCLGTKQTKLAVERSGVDWASINDRASAGTWPLGLATWKSQSVLKGLKAFWG